MKRVAALLLTNHNDHVRAKRVAALRFLVREYSGILLGLWQNSQDHHRGSL